MLLLDKKNVIIRDQNHCLAKIQKFKTIVIFNYSQTIGA